MSGPKPLPLLAQMQPMVDRWREGKELEAKAYEEKLDASRKKTEESKNPKPVAKKKKITFEQRLAAKRKGDVYSLSGTVLNVHGHPRPTYFRMQNYHYLEGTPLTEVLFCGYERVDHLIQAIESGDYTRHPSRDITLRYVFEPGKSETFQAYQALERQLQSEGAQKIKFHYCSVI